MCVCFPFQIITLYVYELLENECNMTKAILPVSTQTEKRYFPLWFMPLKIKGSIKYENWRKYLGFSVIMILSVPFNKERKGACRTPHSIPPFVFLSRPHSLLLSLFLLPPHLPTSFLGNCLLNKLTVLWRVISKAERHSMLMLNLFCIHLLWRGLSSMPSWSYSLPSSSGFRAHIWSLLFVAGSMFASFIVPSPFVPALTLFRKVVIIFQGAVIRQHWCSQA